jgi:hypothetical protein
MFAEPFRGLAGRPPLVLDGEIAVPDERGHPKANPRWDAFLTGGCASSSAQN